MTKLRFAIVALAALQAGLSLVAAVASCGACGALNLGWAGTVYYGALLAALLLQLEFAVSCGVTLAFATHLVLVMRMADGGGVCGLCLTAAAVAVLILVLRIVESRRQLANLAWGLVPSFVAATLMAAVLTPTGNAEAIAKSVETPASEDGGLSVIVFESPECPYCVRFKKEVAPAAAAVYGDRLRFRYVDAAAFPEIQMTPTIVLKAQSGSSVIEGLPSTQVLIRAIGQMLSSETIVGGSR